MTPLPRSPLSGENTRLKEGGSGVNEEGEDVNEGRGVVTKKVYGYIGPYVKKR